MSKSTYGGTGGSVCRTGRQGRLRSTRGVLTPKCSVALMPDVRHSRRRTKSAPRTRRIYVTGSPASGDGKPLSGVLG